MQNHQELLDAVLQRLNDNKLPLPKHISDLGNSFCTELAKISRQLHKNEYRFGRITGASGESRHEIWHDFHVACSGFLGIGSYRVACYQVLERTRHLVDDDIGKNLGRALDDLYHSSRYWESHRYIDLLNEKNSAEKIDEIVDRFLEAFTEARRLCHVHFQISAFLRSHSRAIGNSPKFG